MKWLQQLKWKYLLLGGFWVGMFIGTHLPKIPEGLEKVSDKTLHATAFAGLSLLLSTATYRKHLAAWQHWGLVLAIIAIYGAIDEVLQIPVGRHCDFNDWLADIAGAIAGLTLFYTALKCRALFHRNNPKESI